MLKRSPRSRLATVLLVVVSIIATYIVLDALLTLRSLAHNHGTRHTYFIVTRNLAKGSVLTSSDFKAHAMFSGDAPTGATTSQPTKLFTRSDIAEGTILTKNMLSKTAESLIDEDNRILFIPTSDILDESISTTTDLVSVSSDDFGARYIAYDATILFDLSPPDSSQYQENNHGYFVEVTQDEAADITQALSQGDVRFALRRNNH